MEELDPGPEALMLLAHRGAVEALAISGMRNDQARVLERALRQEGAEVILSGDLQRAVLLGPVASLAGAAARLREWGRQTEDLGAALAHALMGRVSVPPLRCGDHVLEFGRRTLVMGVVNATPDSFTGDGVGHDVDAALARAETMVDAGAAIIDVGGESSRPGADPVTPEEEVSRVVPVISRLARALPVPVSVDTRKAVVAEAAIEAGAVIVNDIHGLRGDPGMAEVVAAHPHVGVVAMHNQHGVEYGDVVADVCVWLHEALVIAIEHGIAPERVVVDPGFGFGKRPAQNLELVQRLGELRGLGRAVLLGASAKSTLGLLLGGAGVEERIDASLALVALAIAQGVDIVRANDVPATVRACRAADQVVRGITEDVRALRSPGQTL